MFSSMVLSRGGYYGLGVAALDGKVCTAGGVGSSGSGRKGVVCYDFDKKAWDSPLPLTNGMRSDYTKMVVVGGKICVAGPVSASTSSGECFDFSTRKWTAMNTQWTGMNAFFNFGMAAVDGTKICVVGGQDGTFNEIANAQCYDLSTQAWTVISSMGTKRSSLGLVAYGGKLYAVGGGESGADKGKVTESYDFSTNTWTRLKSMGVARGNFGLVVVGGQMCAVGGSGSDYSTRPLGDTTDALASGECFDFSTQEWTPIPPMNLGRFDMGLAALGGKICAVGGADDNVNPIASVECYRHFAPPPPAPFLPPLAPAAVTGIVAGSVASGSALAMLPAFSHAAHTAATGLLFRGQVLGMLGQFDASWSSSSHMHNLQSGLRIFNFQFKGFAQTVSGRGAAGGGARRRLSIQSTAADLGIQPVQMFPVLLAEMLLVSLTVMLIWTCVWRFRVRYRKPGREKEEVGEEGDAGLVSRLGDAVSDFSANVKKKLTEAEKRKIAKAQEAMDYHASMSKAAKESTGSGSVLSLGTLKTAFSNAKDAAQWMGDDYNGGNDKSHWSGLMLCCWFFDKFYMPIVTAATFHITTVFGMKKPDYFTITCMLAIVMMTGCVLWLPFLWRLLHPAVAKLPDGEINVGPPPIARGGGLLRVAVSNAFGGGDEKKRKTLALGDGRRAAYDSVYADNDGAAAYGSAKSDFASEDGASEAPLLPTDAAPESDCCGRLRRCWGAVRRRCRRGGRVVRREPLFLRYKAFRTAAYGTWAMGARNEGAARTMALEFFVHRLVLGLVIGVAVESTNGQLVLAWLVSICFCATSYSMGNTAEKVADIADKVPLVQVPAHVIANTFESAVAWKAHLIGRISVCIVYFIALINVTTGACKDPDSEQCAAVSTAGLAVCCISFVLPLAIVFYDKCSDSAKADKTLQHSEGGAGPAGDEEEAVEDDAYQEHVDDAGGGVARAGSSSIAKPQVPSATKVPPVPPTATEVPRAPTAATEEPLSPPATKVPPGPAAGPGNSRAQFTSSQAASLRKQGARNLVGMQLRIFDTEEGRCGKVVGVKKSLGGSTKHTIVFEGGSGKAEGMLLQKGDGGKGCRFHVLEE
jgi:hypothetical protein